MARRKRESQVYRGTANPMKINQSELNHDVVRRMYRRVLREIVVNRFTWRDLPDGIDHRFLEMRLMYEGNAVFYYDDDFNRYVVGRAALTGQPNVYDNPTKFNVIRAGMPNKMLSAKSCVPIYANYLREPDMDVVEVFSAKLAHIDRTIDINLINQRHPVVFSGTEEQRLSAINTFRQLKDGEPFIVANPSLDPTNSMVAFKTEVSDMSTLNLILAKQKLWNECMTLLGVNNANQDKKERLVADEVSANDEQVMVNRGIGLNARTDACQLINQKWGLNVSVEWAPVPITASLGEPGDLKTMGDLSAMGGEAPESGFGGML